MIICVTGMHRSGTSLTASWLQACGLTLVHREAVLPGSDNPKGFFEDREFVRFQADCLRLRYPRSAGWKVAPGQFLHFSQSEIETARQLISIRQSSYPDWAWKDPRSTLFLPAWKALIPDLKVLLIWRPCEQVAQSLLQRWWRHRNRARFNSPTNAIRLWLAHNRLVCHYAEMDPRNTLVITPHQLIQSDKAVLALINTRFNTNLNYVPIQSLYDPELLHGQPGLPFLGWLSTWMGSRTVEKQLQAVTAAL